MKIAFTSCFDVLDDNIQKVWTTIASHKPDALLLLGDSIYMDFGFWPLSTHPLGKPRKWSEQQFADEMYLRYEKQSQVASFRALLSQTSYIGATWDDHDFAWNNSAGAGATDNKRVVPTNKKLIAKSLYKQFLTWLRTKPLPQTYPKQLSINAMLQEQDHGIEETFDIGNVRILMTDGRYYREEKDTDSGDNVPSLLGAQQRSWLTREIKQWAGISLICSGSTLTGRSGTWEQYLDLAWLKEQKFQKTMVLSGDIHKIASQRHKDIDNLWEFTASGAARPYPGGDSGNFGILDIESNNCAAQLYDEDGLDKEKTVVFP